MTDANISMNAFGLHGHQCSLYGFFCYCLFAVFALTIQLDAQGFCSSSYQI